MAKIRLETPRDINAREQLIDQAFGAARFRRAAERLRAGRLPADGLSFVAEDGDRLVGTVRLWHVTAGLQRPALLLGPLVVDPAFREEGIGSALMHHAIEAAQDGRHRAVLLVGDASYYGRFGFSDKKTGSLRLSGGYDPQRFLALELQPSSLDGANGLVRASGRRLPKLVQRPLVASVSGTIHPTALIWPRAA